MASTQMTPMDIEPNSNKNETTAPTRTNNDENTNPNVNPQNYQTGFVGHHNHSGVNPPFMGELKTGGEAETKENKNNGGGNMVEFKRRQARMIEEYAKVKNGFTAMKQNYNSELIPTVRCQLPIQNTYSKGGLKELKLKRKRICGVVDVTIDQIAALLEVLEEKTIAVGNIKYQEENYQENLQDHDHDIVELRDIQREAKMRAQKVKRRKLNRFIDDEAEEAELCGKGHTHL